MRALVCDKAWKYLQAPETENYLEGARVIAATYCSENYAECNLAAGVRQIGAEAPAALVGMVCAGLSGGAGAGPRGTPRTFGSPDDHVADVANAVEAAMPGRVVDVNMHRVMSNGLTREIDIDLGKIYVQVKGGAADGLTGRIAKTQQNAGRMTVGLAPEMSDAAWKNAALQGMPVFRTADDLIAYVKEFG